MRYRCRVLVMARPCGLLAALLLLACGASEERGEQAPVRLLERLDGARVEWPQLGSPGPPMPLEPPVT